MNFKNWKIVDIDNFMNGNSYFSTIQEGDVWHSKVKQTMGTEAIWMEEKVKSPNFLEEILMPEKEKIVSKNEGIDTKSNRKMSPLHKEK